ncbi:MAG TPA: FAD-dependent oxidoreductase [Jiangellaceae bacterium]|nr:FAD-dependent oxidoreductase [Jiangellaceae bacterium]
MPESSSRPLRVAVIGAGPGGIYAAGALLGTDLAVSVDVFDRLPTPSGLVRYGVAPDHPKIKSVAETLAAILEAPEVRFFGNVAYGTDINQEDLARHYDAVIHASGIPDPRPLGIPGEELLGSYTADEFITWYNGHPNAELSTFLDARQVAVIGAGNVALDVVRMLLRTADEVGATDVPDDVVTTWKRASAEEIHLLSRRGPAQAKFTTVELRELAKVEDVDIVIDPADLELDPAGEQLLEQDKAARRNVEVFRAWADEPSTGQSRRVHLHFWSRPRAITGTEQVEGLEVERTALNDDDQLVAEGSREQLEVQAVFSAVGYVPRLVPGLPVDPDATAVPNDDGRVLASDGVVPGCYVAGWLKRGPTGVIGTNKSDATATVATLLADAEAGGLPAPAAPDPDTVPALLDERGIAYVSWEQWLELDAHELSEGSNQGRVRSKVATVEAMMDIAHRARGSP